MKKIFALVLAAMMLALSLTGCGSSGTSLSDVQKAGKLVIATSPDFPPLKPWIITKSSVLRSTF